MTDFHSLPGNKGIPEPRPGYEQRKIIHKKYSEAVAKGWNKRTDVDYIDSEFILCERSLKDCGIQNVVHVIKETVEEATTSHSELKGAIATTNKSNEIIKIIPVIKQSTHTKKEGSKATL